MVVSNAGSPAPLLCFQGDLCIPAGWEWMPIISRILEDQACKEASKSQPLLSSRRGEAGGGAGGPVYWQGPDLPPPSL